ncbi:ATP-binding protein [Niveibacterium sp. COAC-50]|uniref:PAS domain-containing sensor histidine kinase n=1 Tax=Niveibacterium sp. COAC-50 TaxID=2729384 RepID=UPI0015542004|nr:ATP-binding protein [Niveibacterium sp. COAC-50]
MRETWHRLFGGDSTGPAFGLGDQLVPVLRDLLVVVGLLVFTFAAFMLLTGWHSSPVAMYSLLGALLFWPLFFVLIRRRVVRPVVVILMLLCCAIAVSIALRLGTIRTLQMSGVFVAVVVGTLVLGRRTGGIALLLVLALVWSGGLLQLAHGSASDSRALVFNQAATFSFFAIMLYAILVIVRQHYIEALSERDRSAADRLLASEALAESEDKFATLFREGPLAALILSPDNGRVREANQAFLRLAGMSAAEVQDMPFDGLGLMLPGESLLAEWSALAAGALPIEGRAITLAARDQRRVVCELSARAVSVRGRPFVIAQFVDVTARHEAEQRVRESEGRIAAAFEVSPDAWTLNDLASGRYLAVNRIWEIWSGYARSEAIGRTALELGIVRSQQDMAQIRDALQAGGGAINQLDIVLQRRNGETRRCAMSARIFAVGDTRYVITSSRDTTDEWATREALAELNHGLEEKVAERTAELEQVNRELIRTVAELGSAQDELVRQEKLASLGAMVAGVAHELNTPIGNSVTLATTVSHEAGLILRAAQGGGLRRSELLNALRTCDEAAKLLTRNLASAHELISSFKQVAVDQTSEARRVFGFAHSLEEIVATLRPSLRATAIALELELDGDLRLDSFPGALARVVTNLVDNARIHAFSPGAGGHITVSGRVINDDAVELVVADNGCGIPPENQRKVFDPFFTTRLGQGGSGLGLHIVFTLVTRVLGGRIALESAGAEGTRVRISLPRVAPAGGESVEQPFHGVVQ